MMISSIRTFLLINLLLSVAIITSCAIVGHLMLSHQEVQSQLDKRLLQATQNLRAILNTQLTPEQFARLQQQLLILPTKISLKPALSTDKVTTHNAINDYEFQLWDQHGRILLHSSTAPLMPLSDGKPGIATFFSDGTGWRVATTYLDSNQLTVMIAERLITRHQFENILTKNSIFILLLTYPLLGFLIWIIVGRALQPLKKVAAAFSRRAPSNLKPVPATGVPHEVLPLVKELNELFNRLHEAFEREKRFTADAAHELKTPLAAINAQTQVALRTENSEDRKQALLKIIEGVKRSNHVIHQLLTLSRMAPEANIEEPIAVLLAREATDVAAMLAPEAIAKNIELEFLNPDISVTIEGIPGAINILIRNLVDNAIRYTPEGGQVQIDIKEQPNNVAFIVTDNGPGIPKKLHKRVFERFYRVVGNKSPGSGLGLGIVQQIVKLHKARISLHTPPSGTGLEVIVEFPRTKNPTKTK